VIKTVNPPPEATEGDEKIYDSQISWLSRVYVKGGLSPCLMGTRCLYVYCICFLMYFVFFIVVCVKCISVCALQLQCLECVR